MNAKRRLIQVCRLGLLLLALPSAVQAQYSYSISSGYVTITGYTGNPTTVNIPGTISGDPVIAIQEHAFNGCSSLTSVTIPSSVQSIGAFAFAQCGNLTSISVNGSNPLYSSINGALFNKSGTVLIQYPGGLGGSYTIPSSVTSLGDYAFYYCARLTNVVIPTNVTSLGSGVFEYCSLLTSVTLPGSITSLGGDMFFSCSALASLTVPSSVTNLGNYAFLSCPGLTSVYFKGNAPAANSTVFSGDNVKIYYLPGTTGWGTFVSTTGQSPVLWNPQAQTGDGGFGVRTNRFGFNLNGSANIVVVVEACTNFSNPVWQPVQTNTLTGGAAYFSDPQWTNYPSRFYRLRSAQ